MNEITATVAIYKGDREWLQARQLRISADNAARTGKPGWVTMPDLVRGIITAIQAAEASSRPRTLPSHYCDSGNCSVCGDGTGDGA